MTAELTDRLRREIEHGSKDIALRQAEAGWDSPAGRVRRDRRATFLLNQIPRSARILEIGARTGMHTLGLVAAIDDVTAIDISPDLLKIAKRRAPRAKYRLMDGHAPEFSPGTFDAILGVSILHHLNWDIALANYFRLLRPQGIVRFSEPNLLNPQIYVQKNIPVLKRLAGDSPDEYAFTRWQIARSLRKIGFTAICVKAFEFLHPATPERLIPLATKVENWLSRIALNEIAGSLLIEASRP